MDERALNELLECSVCLDRLDHTNKVLPCQHTFCRKCLEVIVKTTKELRCPECRTVVKQPVEALPTNILLVRLLESMKTAAVCSGTRIASSSICQTSPSHTGAMHAQTAKVRHLQLSSSQQCNFV